MSDPELAGVEGCLVDDVLLERIDCLREHGDRLATVSLAHEPNPVERARQRQDLGIVEAVADLERLVDDRLLMPRVAQEL